MRAFFTVATVMLVTVCFTTALHAADQDGLNEYVDGLNALVAGKYTDAEKLFMKAIDADEENPNYYIARGVAQALSEDPKKAESTFNRALKLKPGDNEARLWLASVVAMQGDFMRTSEIYPMAQHNKPYENAVREITRQYGDAVWKREKAKQEGEEYWDMKKIDADQKAAIKQFPELAQRFVDREKSSNPALAKALESRVTKQLENADVSGSLDDLNRLLAQRPNDQKLLMMHAGAALAQGAPAVARAEYTIVLTQGDNAEAFAGRARAAAQMGDVDRAQKDLAIASQLNPALSTQFKQSVEADIKTNSVEVKKEDLPALLIKLHDSAEKQAKWDELVNEASTLIRAVNRHRLRADEAYGQRLRELQLATKNTPSTSSAYADLGEFLYRNAIEARGDLVEPRASLKPFRPLTEQSQQQEVAQAEAALDRALSMDPNSLKALTFKAACLVWRMQWGDAETLLKKALAIQPDDPQVLRLFAQVMDHVAAVKAMNASSLRQTTSWSDLNYIYTRYPSKAELAAADEYDRQAQRLWDLAMTAMQNAAAARKGTAEGFYYQGVLDRRLGDLKAAKASYEKAIELKPDFLDAREELVGTCSMLGLVEEALNAKVMADNLVNTTAAPLLRLTWMMIPRTKFKTARLALDGAASFDPADARVAAYRGTLAVEKENLEDAMAWYRAAAAILEAESRMNGTSAARPAMQARLEPDEVALATAVNLKAALLLLQQNRPEEALDLCRAVTLVEPRVNKDNLYQPLASGMIPDASMDPTTIPQADHLAYYLAWAHYGAGKALFAMNKPKEALEEARLAAAYLDNKPATADAGTRIREVNARASVLAGRAALATGDRQTAEMVVMSWQSARWIPQDLKDEIQQLKTELGQSDNGNMDNTPQPPPRRRGRGR